MGQLAHAHADAVLRAENYQRAKHFYHDVLGFVVEDIPGQGESGMVRLPEGSDFMIYERPGMPAPQNTTLSFEVEDVQGAVTELREKGVVFEEYDIPEMHLKTDGGVAHMPTGDFAWFKDSEGNILALGAR